MSADTKWSDLIPRVASAVILVLFGGIEIYIGGWPFSVMVWVLCGLMSWELARMFRAKSPVALGALGALALALAEIVPALGAADLIATPLLSAAALVGAGQVAKDKILMGLSLLWVLGGSYAILMMRHFAGLDWIIWLVAVVVVSDVAGYFVGRTFGGPKFWPRVSPKKTWSGTVAGWIGAAGVGAIFSGVTGAGAAMIPISIVLAFAGQMGDITESALKRRCFVKDSSSLIPGHGGVFDRFDAMLGAAFFVFLLWTLGLMPGLT
jgi:phosphatidate cytidylyltransferase